MDAVDDPKGYYRVLGVRRSASADEIRTAFREKAKLYHPDSGSPFADEERFALLVEAYETLRDPERRRLYDADAFARVRARVEAGAARATSRTARRPPPLVPRERLRPFASSITLAVAGLLMVGLGALWWSAERQLVLRNREIEQLSLRLAELMAGQAEGLSRRRLESAAVRESPGARAEGGATFSAEISFPPGSAELDEGGRSQLEKAVADLSAAIARTATGREWAILVESSVPSAVVAHGLDVEMWQTAVLRLAEVVDRLARVGLPPERVSVRFEAGRTAGQGGAGEGQAVVIRLVCCLGSK